MRRANVEVRRHTLIYRCSGGDVPMAYWLFQGNPKYYRILDGIRDFT